MDEKGKSKKRYETPKLTILARGNPEEAVLGGCKWTAAGPGNAASACHYGGGGCGWGSNHGGYYCAPLCNENRAS